MVNKLLHWLGGISREEAKDIRYVVRRVKLESVAMIENYENACEDVRQMQEVLKTMGNQQRADKMTIKVLSDKIEELKKPKAKPKKRKPAKPTKK